MKFTRRYYLIAHQLTVIRNSGLKKNVDLHKNYTHGVEIDDKRILRVCI